jgi:hypothetical protein
MDNIPYDRPCPICNAQPKESCKNAAGQAIPDIHPERWPINNPTKNDQPEQKISPLAGGQVTKGLMRVLNSIPARDSNTVSNCSPANDFEPGYLEVCGLD